MIQVDWITFKQIIITKEIAIQYVEGVQFYTLLAFDGPMQLFCRIEKENNEDQIDFEANYKSGANKKLSIPKDSDGSPLQRIKITTSGWHYQLHGLEFETSKLNSLYSKKVDNTNYSFGNLKFYESIDGIETEITGDNLNQSYLDSSCIKTIMDWEPTYDLEIIGGMLKMNTSPNEDLRMWVVGVPDVPEAYGGSKSFAVNVNLKYVGIEEGVKVDGRAPKYLTYNATYHTNRIRMIFRHSAGFKHNLMMVFEIFKA